MFKERFIDFYNNELYYLREVGKEFAEENPQIAKNLGFHSDFVQDPFVERLLEGTAFLSARVQEKLSNEQPEFALQMLYKLAPLWYTPTPSMALISFEPDLTYPQWDNSNVLPRGSKLLLKDPSLDNKPSFFTTGRDVNIQPLIIEKAQCSVSAPEYLSKSVLNFFSDALSFISIKCSTKNTAVISDLEISPFNLTVTGDVVKINQIINNIFNNCIRIVLWSKSNNRPIYEVLDISDVELKGINEENLLPFAIGELPGCRILREYFNMQSNFFTFSIKNTNSFFSKCINSDEFEIFFVLKNRDITLVNNITISNFRLFVTPIINLYKKRCNPVLLDHNRVENQVVVDRHNPTLYKIYNLEEVKGLMPDGNQVNFSPFQMDSYYGDDTNKAVYSFRRKQNYIVDMKYKNSSLSYDDIFISLSSGNTLIDIDQLKSVSVVALVSDRHLIPELLQDPVFTLEKSLPINKIELLNQPTRSVDVPDIHLAWNALQVIADNPLRYLYPRIKDCSFLIKNWLSLFININDSSHIKKLNSIQKINFKHKYVRYEGPGPIAWTRGVEADINILSKNHSDKGEFIFGKILTSALSEYCELNQKLSLNLSVDDNFITKLKIYE